MGPAAIALIAAAIQAGAQAGGQAISSKKAKKGGKLRAEETKRETMANILNDALNQRGERFSRNLASRERHAKSAGETHKNTADLVRGAFNM